MIIGITGKKFSGKDVVADWLITNERFTRYKFADPIKSSVAEVFLWDDDWINGSKKEVIDPRWGISPRQAQQAVGTELFRIRLAELFDLFDEVTGDTVWCKRFKYWYEMQPEGTNIVVSDLRFLNEFKILKEMGAHIIRIERDGLESADQHPSETEMEKIVPDYTLFNDSTIEGLHNKIAMLYPQLFYSDFG